MQLGKKKDNSEVGKKIWLELSLRKMYKELISKKRCSTPLVTREIQVKITVGCHFMLTRMPIIRNKTKDIITGTDKGTGKPEPLCIVHGL